jgi:hypothetical protein
MTTTSKYNKSEIMKEAMAYIIVNTETIPMQQACKFVFSSHEEADKYLQLHKDTVFKNCMVAELEN